MMSEENEEKIAAGNKLIAEFMGWKEVSYPTHMKSPFHGRSVWWSPTSTDGKTRSFSGFVGEELFYESWDFLMPVVRKCKIIEMTYEYEFSTMNRYIHAVVIEKAWQEVIVFIQWYNKGQKNRK